MSEAPVPAARRRRKPFDPVRKHISIVCQGCDHFGAVANVALHHSRELSREFRVTLLSDGFPDSKDSSDVEWVSVDSPGFGFLRRYSHVPREVGFALKARKLLKYLHTESPLALIMCHGHPVATLTALPLKKRFGIPYSLTIHGDIFDRPKGTYDRILTAFYRRTTPVAYRGADQVFTLSPYMEQIARERGTAQDRVTTIPNGIEPGEIGLAENKPSPVRRSSDALNILYVGRLANEKGIKVLVSAVHILHKRNANFQLRLAGTGPEEDWIKKYVRKHKLQNYVELLGSVPRLELGTLYRSAEVVCVPSVNDPLPTVVLEAMMAGVAVVGSNIGGIPHMIDHGVTGFLFPAGDDLALVELFEDLQTKKDYLHRIGEAARQHVNNKYRWADIGHRLVGHIRKNILSPER